MKRILRFTNFLLIIIGATITLDYISMLDSYLADGLLVFAYVFWGVMMFAYVIFLISKIKKYK